MYKVQGYKFETKEQARIARQEVEKVHFFKSQTSMEDPDVVLTLYNKLVEREVFVTPVGMGYLLELQQYLNMIPYIKEEDILPIPVYEPDESAKDAPARKQASKRQKEKAKELRRLKRGKNRDYRRLFHISTFFAVVFAVAAIGMLAMTWISVDNVNIINYENEIINKYESWEQELDEREAQLKEREEKLEQSH